MNWSENLDVAWALFKELSTSSWNSLSLLEPVIVDQSVQAAASGPSRWWTDFRHCDHIPFVFTFLCGLCGPATIFSEMLSSGREQTTTTTSLKVESSAMFNDRHAHLVVIPVSNGVLVDIMNSIDLLRSDVSPTLSESTDSTSTSTSFFLERHALHVIRSIEISEACTNLSNLPS